MKRLLFYMMMLLAVFSCASKKSVETAHTEMTIHSSGDSTANLYKTSSMTDSTFQNEILAIIRNMKLEKEVKVYNLPDSTGRQSLKKTVTEHWNVDTRIGKMSEAGNVSGSNDSMAINTQRKDSFAKSVKSETKKTEKNYSGMAGYLFSTLSVLLIIIVLIWIKNRKDRLS